MIDVVYQVTGLASVIAFSVLGLAARRAIESADRRRRQEHGRGRGR